MRSLNTSLFACLALVAMTAAAGAQIQQPGVPAGSQIGSHAAKADERGDKAADANKVKANDKAYNAALKNLPDKQYDPWHGVR
jgi:hypothetical protein